MLDAWKTVVSRLLFMVVSAFFLVNVNNCGKHNFLQQFITAESSTFHTGHVSLLSTLVAWV